MERLFQSTASMTGNSETSGAYTHEQPLSASLLDLFTIGRILRAMKVANLELEPQPERDLVKLPPEFDFEPALDIAFRHASNYTVAFVMDGQVVGSGTLVSAKGVHGILTAHHVMLVPEKTGAHEFSLCIRNNAIHRVDVKQSQYHHLVLGDSRRHFDHSGPNLSFLMITDKSLFSTLDSVKSFYPLVPRCDVHQFPAEKMRLLPWGVSGSPAEFSKEIGVYKGETLTKFTDFHLAAHFHQLRQKGPFDYFRFQVHSGVHGFPKKYGGVSGGGIWTMTMQRKRNGEIDFPPMLQGVVFYQSRPYWKQQRRLLVGHGPRSIYEFLLKSL